jgi:hypothetical protein
MSVTSIYLTVDWQTFQTLAQQADLEEQLDAAQDNEESWIHEFHFGRQIDRELFENRHFLSQFDDWFRDARKRQASGRLPAVESFRVLFLEFGLIHEDDDLKLKPLNRLSQAKGEWLIGAMSPEDVWSLRDRAAAIDRRELAVWFDAVLALKPSSLIEDGKTAVDWLDALKAGLDDTVRKRAGIVFGIA